MRLRFLEFLAVASLACATAGAAVACGGISDPNQTGATSEKTATITGKLTGSAIPSGARVALVWKTKTPNTVIIGADVPVTGNTFTMTLTQPAESAFFSEEDQQNAGTFDDSSSAPSTGTSGGGGAASGGTGGAAPEPAPAPAPTPAPLPAQIRPLDTATGSVVTDPFTVALAGFVLYADANGNGKLDIDVNASLSTPDTILGGSHDLALAYLRGGGQLAYEKLRDKTGQLPTPGFNLMWAQKERWLPMTAIELSLGSKILLPSAVCSGQDVAVATARPAEVVCSSDGRSYHYESTDCVPSPPVPPGLCSGGYESDACGGSASSENTLPDGPVPSWWPCPVVPTTEADAGPASDAGQGSSTDAGAP